ncbi:hypothetical protein [Aurantiacibacter aquimixticola]|nr:hypothetical protein [Aurantiacibacter aquimixticola]
MKLKLLVAVGAMASLSACASTYVGTPYTAPDVPVTRVAVADDALPENVIARQAASTMSNFGLIGGLIDAGVQASRKDAVNEALDTIGYTPEETLEALIVERFAGTGVTASVVEGPDREKREFLVEYPVGPAGTQAHFDLVIQQFGYMQAGGNAWRPAVLADVRMVDATTGATLLENRIALNWVDSPAGVIALSPNPAYAFANREDMVTNPQLLAEGIDDALATVVDAAIGLIR